METPRRPALPVATINGGTAPVVAAFTGSEVKLRTGPVMVLGLTGIPLPDGAAAVPLLAPMG
jgi:hypothetical protein